MPTRRSFLGSCVAAALSGQSSVIHGAPQELARSGIDQDQRWLEIAVAGPDGVRRQALLLTPLLAQPGQRYPALLLFHGRGEADDPRAGLHAWRSLYGLASSYALLRRGPLEPDAERSHYMRPAQLAALNEQLAREPFAGLVVICPVTPNPSTAAQPEQMLANFADWVEHALLPRAAELAPIDPTPRLGLDGCSMGGNVGAEVFTRKPHLFSTFGLVQPALNQGRLQLLAKRLAEISGRPGFAGIHLETSSDDPYRERTLALSHELARRHVPHMLDVLLGPHNQRWLRAAGTLTMLAWQARMLQFAERGRSIGAPVERTTELP